MTIYVAYDKNECMPIAAAKSMDEAIKLSLRYMFSHDYLCKEFCYDESYTIIEYEQDYRIGAEMEHLEDTILIMETYLFGTGD